MGKRKLTKSQRKRVQRPPIDYRGFFAYPNADKAQSEIIETAVKRVNSDIGLRLEILSWPDATRGRIISTILQAISERDFMVADISGSNVNVLFEVGFALGSRKYLVLTSQGNSTQNRQEDLKNIHILSGLNAARYQNAGDLVDCIVRESKGITEGPTIDRYVTAAGGQLKPNGVLFLKGFTKHEYAHAAKEALHKRFPPSQVIIDDWNEDMAQSLKWYLSQLEQRSAVVALFVDSDWDNSIAINARFSVICGIAVAMRKAVLMIGLPGFDVPFDLRDVLKTPKRSRDIGRMIASFLDEDSNDSRTATILQLNPGSSSSKSANPSKASKEEKELVLLDLAIGSGFIPELNNTLAEHEESVLPGYFVETGQFRRMLSAPQALVIGAKGSGKTASLFMLRDRLSTDSRNIVCVLKPSDHKMARFLAALGRVQGSTGHAVQVAESSWKLIVYCEILSEVYRRLTSTRVLASLSTVEREFVDFCDKNAQIVQARFEQRLEIAAQWLEGSDYDADRFGELLHEILLRDASFRLSQLEARKQRIVVLVDNLDKTWEPCQDVGLGLTMILSLLGVHRKLDRELGGKANVSLTVFLRRDIFGAVLEKAREPDKLLSDQIELVWDEPGTLLRVIEERFRAASAKHIGCEVNPWSTFFPVAVEGIPTQEWILAHTMCRPRDLIHLVRRSIELALNRSNSTIEESDLRDACRDYSEFALEQLIAEYQVEHQWLPDIVRSFAGQTPRMTLRKLTNHIERLAVAMKLPVDTDQIIATLVSIGFLGVSFDRNADVRYAGDIKKARMLRGAVLRGRARTLREFAVHPVFCAGLAIGKSAGDEWDDRGPRNPHDVLKALISAFRDAFDL